MEKKFNSWASGLIAIAICSVIISVIFRFAIIDLPYRDWPATLKAMYIFLQLYCILRIVANTNFKK